MTRDPSGKRCSRKPSPSWTRSGGVRSSTSNTRPGLVISSSPWVEGHLDGAETAGGERVIERLSPSGQRVDRTDQPFERGLASEVNGEIERRNPPGVRDLGRRRVGTDHFQLSEPDRREVGAPVRHAGEDDASAGAGGPEGEVQAGPGPGALE